MSKTLRTRIIQKYATVAQWEASDLVLLKGELAIDDLNRIKIGDGTKTWNELEFAVDTPKAPVESLASLPSASSSSYAPGDLVLTSDGKLWCLVETPVEGSDETERSWADLTNNADIAAIQADIEALQSDVEGVESGLVALKADVDAKDAAHDAAIVALQASISGELDEEIENIKADVATNVENIAANRADIDAIYDSQSGKINSSVLPSFVDDVVEGLVCISDTDSDATYNLTHNGDAVVGFFGASGAEEGNTRALKFITAGSPETANLSAVSYAENGVTYTFPADPVADKIAPSSSIIYVDVRTNKTYRWSGSQFVVVASDLALGETASTAYAGDRGAALYDEVFTADTGLKDRATALETAVEELQEKDEAHEAALVALQAECDAKHQELEDEIASSIVALKQESEQADAAHEAALVALQQQVATVSEVDFNTVLSNSTDTLNSDVLIIDCGGAE